MQACLRHKRPVYIEVPHDMVDRVINIPAMEPIKTPRSDALSLKAALAETLEMIAKAKQPVLLAGVELHRFGVTDLALQAGRARNIPIASDLLSKGAVAENHPLYLGVYGGAMSSDAAVRQYVESSDCVLMLGTFITDMSMGIYTARLDRNRTVLATTETIGVRYHRYDDVQFVDFLRALSSASLEAQEVFAPQSSLRSQAADKVGIDR